MIVTGIRSVFKLCLISAGSSALNLGINFNFIKNTMNENKKNNLKNLTVEKIISTPPKEQSSIPEEDIIKDDEDVNVSIVNDLAYWIKNNKVYTSRINKFGDIDVKNAKVVDVFKLSNKETQMLLKIVDNLNSN